MYNVIFYLILPTTSDGHSWGKDRKDSPPFPCGDRALVQVKVKVGTDSPGQGWCHEYATCAVTQGPTLRKALCSVSFSVVTALKFLIHFEQGSCIFLLH